MNRKEKFMRNYNLLCLFTALAGVYTGVRAFKLSAQAAEMIKNSGIDFAGINVAILIVSLFVPAMLILSGAFGYFKKTTAAIVFSGIGAVASLFSLITSITTISATMGWSGLLANLIPMISAAALPIIFIVYTALNKKLLS